MMNSRILQATVFAGILCSGAIALASPQAEEDLPGSIYGAFLLGEEGLNMVSVMPEEGEDAQSSALESAELDSTRVDPVARREVGESVTAAIKAALRHDPRIKTAESRVSSAKADRFRALGQFLPEIEASASYTDDKFRSNTLQTLQDRDGTTLGVTAVQPIFQGLATINSFRETRARLSQQDYALIAALQQTALDAARAHARVVLDREIVQHRVDNLTLVRRQLDVADKRQKAGAQSRTGVEQARMRLAQAQVDLGSARATLAESEAAYTRITGRAAPAEFTGDDRDRVAALTSLEEALGYAYEFNPLMLSAEQSLKAAKHAKRAAVGAFAPRVTLEGSYFRRLGEDQALTSRDEEYQLVARMRMPIFRQGKNVAGLQAASATISGEQAQLVSTRLSIEETVTRQWRNLAEAELKRVSATQGIAAAEASVKGLQLEYEAGQRTVIDVLDGQRDLVRAQISLSQARFDVRSSQYELAAASGMILETFGLHQR